MLRAPNRLSWIAAFLIGTAVPAGAEVELISKVHPRYVSDTGIGESEAKSISTDGRYVAFVSEAPNLLPGQVDSNLAADVFVYDRVTGSTELVSRSADQPTAAGDRPSIDAAISADGRYVVFVSFASDLVAGQEEGNDYSDIFLYDRVTGRTDLVSHAISSRTTTSSNGFLGSSDPVISANGRYVAFSSDSADLIEYWDPEDPIPPQNVFLYDRITGKVELVSRSLGSAWVPASDYSARPAISANGRFVAFVSLVNDLVAGQSDANGEPDVFLYDRTAKTVTLVSHASSSPTTAANGTGTRRPAISADGGTVVFDSTATNLVPGQTGRAGPSNVFLFERATGRTSLVSHASSSLTTSGDSGGGTFAVSANGSFVAFTSFSRNLVPRQAERARRTSDVFLYNRANERIILVSGAGGSSTRVANGSSAVRGVSADGSLILLQSTATDLARGVADTNGTTDVFLYDRRSGRTSLVSHGAASSTTAGNGESQGSILSANGRWVAFQTAATNFASGMRDLNQSLDLVLDGGAAGREVVSRRAPDLPSDTTQGQSEAESISADGRFVVFRSLAPWLVAGQRDTNGDDDVFLHDRELGKTVLVSHSAASPNTAGNGYSLYSQISADGRFVTFVSTATNLTPGPAEPAYRKDIFLYERETGITTRVGSTEPPEPTPWLPSPPAISADGSFVAFSSIATDVVPGQIDSNLRPDVFLYERATGTTTLVSRVPGSAATAGNDISWLDLDLSADGRFLIFTSAATNLVPGQIDRPGTSDVFLYDRVTGTTTLVSRTAASLTSAAGGGLPVLSADGRFVAFFSNGTDLVAGQVDSPETSDLFLYDRLSGVHTLVTHAPGSAVTAAGDGALETWGLALSADGRFVAFASHTSRLVTGQVEGSRNSDIFLFDRETGALTLVSRVAGSTATTGDNESYGPSLSADGRLLAFWTRATDLLPQKADRFVEQVLLYDRVTGELVLASPSRFSSLEPANGGSYRPFLSADGSALAFTSLASDLVPRDLNVLPDVFVYTSER